MPLHHLFLEIHRLPQPLIPFSSSQDELVTDLSFCDLLKSRLWQLRMTVKAKHRII